MSDKDQQNLVLLIGKMNGTIEAIQEKLEDSIISSNRAIETLTQEVSALKIWRATIVAKVSIITGLAAFAWVFVWELIKKKFFNS